MSCSSNVIRKLVDVRQLIFSESECNMLLWGISESFCPFPVSEIMVSELFPEKYRFKKSQIRTCMEY